MPINNLLRAAAVIAIAAGTACVGGDSNAPDAVPIEQTTFAPALGVNLAGSTKLSTGVYYRDITVGTGPVIATGQIIQVRYTGWLSDGSQFDSNIGKALLEFQLGASNIIKGFNDGLAGARVGTTRQLIIPPSRGYGPYDYNGIPGNSILVFNVEVVTAL